MKRQSRGSHYLDNEARFYETTRLLLPIFPVLIVFGYCLNWNRGPMGWLREKRSLVSQKRFSQCLKLDCHGLLILINKWITSF